MNDLISDKLFRVDNRLLVLVDKWRGYAPPGVPDFIKIPGENLDTIECWFELLWLSSSFRPDDAENVTASTDQRHGIIGSTLPPRSSLLSGAAAGRILPRRRLSLVARTLVAGFVDLCWGIDGGLDAFPDEGEAALERGIYLSNCSMNGIVDLLKEPRDLVGTEKCIDINNK